MERITKVKYDPRSANEFSSWYYQIIKNNQKEKERVINEEPILALRVFNIFGDKNLGKMFIEKYKNHFTLSHVAYLIARELKHKFAREYLEAQKEQFRHLDLYTSGPVSVHLCGNDISSTNYWMENAWDNCVRLLEDKI